MRDSNFSSALKVSIIIPTYKRAFSLERTLNSLSQQTCALLEVIVVDNAASSEIENLVTTYQRQFSIPLRYIPEPNLGLHNARHAGVRAAQGDLFLFSDDDATFDPHWAQSYLDAFAQHSSMGAAGGPIRPIWEVTPPRWLFDLLKGKNMFPILSLLELQSKFTLSEAGTFFGVNMAIRRNVLFDVGGFNPEAFGSVWWGNGETGLNQELWRRNFLIGYVPEAVVFHHIPADRMTIDYFKRRISNEGACDMYTRFHERVPSQIALAWSALSVALRNVVVWLCAWLVNGRTDRWSLHIQLQAARSQAQLRYISRLRADEQFRSFVMTRDWLNGPCTLA